MTDLLSSIVVFAAETGGAPAAGQGVARSPGKSLFGMVPIIAVLVLLFVFWTRSEKKRHKKRRDLIDSIRPKDDIVTIGGIRGRVVQVRDDEIVLRIDPEKDIKITVAKTGISRKLGDEEPE